MSRKHRAACDNFGSADIDISGAPSVNDFESVLEHCRTSPIGEHRLQAIGGRKIRKMQWCLAEGSRLIKRKRLRIAETITILQDTRKGKLQMRGVFCDMQLSRTASHVATVDLAGEFSLDSSGIKRASLEALRRTCTPRRDPPYVTRPAAAPVDAKLLAHVLARIECYSSDAAADEIRAGHMLQGYDTMSRRDVLPSLRYVIRDKPHGSRRTIA